MQLKSLVKRTIARSIAVTLTAVTVTGSVVSIAGEAKAWTRNQSDFLYGVAANLRSVGLNWDAAMLLADGNMQSVALNTGYSACESMDNGATPRDMFQFSVGNGATPATSAHVLAVALSAAATLCSEHSWMITERTTQSSYYAPSDRPYSESVCTLRPDTNIRSGPSTSSSVIGNQSTLRSQAIELHSTERGRDGANWSWISAAGSNRAIDGWVSSEFIVGCR